MADDLKASNLRSMSIPELVQKAESLAKDVMLYRIKKSTGSLTKPHYLKEAKRGLARVLTVLNEKRREEFSE